MDTRVLDALTNACRTLTGNPHSRAHSCGRAAADAVIDARTQVAALVGADPDGIVFTSGATESNNLALAGTSPGHLIVGATEHPSVLEPARALVARGWSLTELPVDGFGRVSPAAVVDALRPDTRLVSLMWANNEIGTLHPVEAIGAALADHPARFHCDATQAAGRIEIDVAAGGIDLLSLSGHKLYGPAGIGALYVRPGVTLSPWLHGGGQQAGLRPGTVDAPSAVAFGLACALARTERLARASRLSTLTDRLVGGLSRLGATRITPESAVPGLVAVTIDGVGADDLLCVLEGVAIASGAACSSGRQSDSHVAIAMGLEPSCRRGLLRLSPGIHTSDGEVDTAVARIAAAVDLLRALAPDEPGRLARSEFSP